MTQMKLISLVVPIYNEEEVLPEFYKRVTSVIDKIQNTQFEFVFVNDGSNDKSLRFLEELRRNDIRVNFIDLSRNFGKEIAMSAGFDFASGDAAIIMDADLQDPPELIPDMVQEWQNGYDDVYAIRRSRKNETFFKKSSSFIFYRILEKVAKIPIQKDVGDFRLLSRKALNSLKMIRESQRYTKGLFSVIGYRKKAIEFEREPRLAGKTKWNYLSLADLAIEGITSFTILPLRIAIFLGVFISIFSFIYLFYIVISALTIGNDVPGYPSLMSVILFLGGVQLVSLGIIGEYLGKVFNETKRRPLYFVNSFNNDDVSSNEIPSEVVDRS